MFGPATAILALLAIASGTEALPLCRPRPSTKNTSVQPQTQQANAVMVSDTGITVPPAVAPLVQPPPSSSSSNTGPVNPPTTDGNTSSPSTSSNTGAASTGPAAGSNTGAPSGASVPTSAGVSVTSTDAPGSSGDKVVLAHHMVGNTYSHTIDTWKQDIQLAQSAGIDGFALNIGSDSWQRDRVADAYAAAKGTNFKLCLSFDMTVLPSGAGDVQSLMQYVTDYYNDANQLKYNGKSFVSTFSGENSNFGQGSAQDGWNNMFLNPLKSSGHEVFFAPGMFLPPAQIASFTGTDAYLNWNSAWATSITTGAVGSNPSQQAVTNLIDSFSDDLTFITPLKAANKEYMGAISAGFFTHYGKDTYNKNWLYNTDWSGYSRRWNTLIQNRDQLNLLEILTWNDYGESSYIGPIGADQPNSQAWVDGFDHTSLLPLTLYFAKAFKTGKYPDVTTDQLFLAARPHTHDAQASADGVGQPNNWQTVNDSVFVDVLATQPSIVVVETSSGKSQSFNVPAGHSSVSVPLTVGGYISATIQRNGQDLVSCKPDGYSFVNNPKTYNFNFFTASCSSRGAYVAP